MIINAAGILNKCIAIIMPDPIAIKPDTMHSGIVPDDIWANLIDFVESVLK